MNEEEIQDVRKKSKAWIWIIIIIILAGIGIGIYFLMNGGILSVEESGEGEIGVGEEIRCVVGNIKTMNTPYGIAGGPVTGIETHSLKNGETKELCCSEVETTSGKKLKVCSRTDENNVIEYDVIWQEINGDYIKLREFIPQFGASCTYNFDSEGNVESRSCA